MTLGQPLVWLGARFAALGFTLWHDGLSLLQLWPRYSLQLAFA
jgi:hypothetical protein